MSDPKLDVEGFPIDYTDPGKKTKEWGIQFARAAFRSYQGFGDQCIGYNRSAMYELNRLYAMGDQPIDRYKKRLVPDDLADSSTLAIDWEVSPVVGTIRDIAVSRMMQQEYGVVATPIDESFKTQLDTKIAAIKAKITLRQMAAQTNPELAMHPILAPESGEPMDMDELNMRLNYSEQLLRSKDCEEAILYAMYINDSPSIRRQVLLDMFDIGLGGVFSWLGEDGLPKSRAIDPAQIITNYCRKSDFSDIRIFGEVIDVDLYDLALQKNDDGKALFSQEDLEEMKAAGSNNQFLGDLGGYYRGRDRGKVKVLDLRWISYEDMVYSDRKNNKGNPVFAKADAFRAKSTSDKYVSKRVQVVYQIKWVIGTRFGYDYQKANDMPRSKDMKKKGLTNLGVRLFAWNFRDMKAKSMIDRLRPHIDEYQMNWYKWQNLKARMVPGGWWIDMDALEAVGLKAGGKDMNPKALLQTFFDSGILLGRSKDIMGDNVNYKPVIPIQNSIVPEVVALQEEMVGQIIGMKQMVGLNELTDGTTPNAKTLNGVATLANQGTNNALYQMQQAEKWIVQKWAGDLFMRMQQAIRRGPISGAIPLNRNAITWIKISPDIDLSDAGIMLEERPTEDEKQFLISNMSNDIQNGFLSLDDAVMILETNNLKSAMMQLGYKVKKAKDQQQQNEMQKISANTQQQQQSAAQTFQFNQQLEEQRSKNKIKEIAVGKEYDLKIKGLDNENKAQIATQNNQAKLAGQIAPMLPPETFQQSPDPADQFRESNIPEQEMQ